VNVPDEVSFPRCGRGGLTVFGDGNYDSFPTLCLHEVVAGEEPIWIRSEITCQAEAEDIGVRTQLDAFRLIHFDE
jgi:hypothetical protein